MRIGFCNPHVRHGVSIAVPGLGLLAEFPRRGAEGCQWERLQTLPDRGKDSPCTSLAGPESALQSDDGPPYAAAP